MHLGIDFGTTRTVVAVADRGNYPVVTFTGHDSALYDYYPSVIADNGHELRFGFSALAMEGQPGWELFRSFKRVLYSGDGGFDRMLGLKQRELPIVDVIAGFLRQLAHDLQERSNLPVKVPVQQLDTVLAVPANAHSAARLITLEAFRIAEYRVMAMLNEPSAAGIEYAHRHRSSLTSKRDNVLVYDMGGGTFDSTLVLMRDHKHDVLLSRGLGRLGGDDFDEVLLCLALRTYGSRANDLPAEAMRRLKNHCREQKEKVHANTRRVLIELGAQLSPEERVALGVDEDAVQMVSTQDFEAACHPLVNRTLDVLGQLQSDWSKELGRDVLPEIAGIYVVGGASSLPVVLRRLRDEYGRRVHRSNYPSGAIAMGLAIALDHDAGYEMTERFSRQFGVFRETQSGTAVDFDVIFDSSTVLPARGQFTEVVRRYPATHNLGHYRYVECGWLDGAGAPSGDITSFANVRFAFDSQLRGQDDLAEIPVHRADYPYCEVEENYRVDENGVIELTIRDVHNGYAKQHRFPRRGELLCAE